MSERPTALPSSLRRPAATAAALAALGFAVLAARYAGGSKAGRFDAHIEDMIDALPLHKGPVSSAVLSFGNPLHVVTAALTLSGSA